MVDPNLVREILEFEAASGERQQQIQLAKDLKSQQAELIRLAEKDANKPKCPHCGGAIDPGYNTCTHCSQAIVWLGNLVGKPGQEKQMEAYRDQLQQKKKIERLKSIEDAPKKELNRIRYDMDRNQDEAKKRTLGGSAYIITTLILIIFAINVDLAVALILYAVSALTGFFGVITFWDAYDSRQRYLKYKEKFIRLQRAELIASQRSPEQKKADVARMYDYEINQPTFEFGSDGFQVASDEIDLDPFLEQS